MLYRCKTRHNNKYTILENIISYLLYSNGRRVSNVNLEKRVGTAQQLGTVSADTTHRRAEL